MTITPLFTLLGASPELISLIHDYMLIWYLTVPMLVVPMVGNAAIRTTGIPRPQSGDGGRRSGQRRAGSSAHLRAGPFPEWGIRGAAIATSLSWLMAMLVSLHLLRKRETLLTRRLSPRPQLLAHWRALLHVAVPASFTNMLNPLANAVLMIIFAGLRNRGGRRLRRGIPGRGLAAHRDDGALFRAGPFISQNCGAGNPARAKAALLLCMRFALLFQLGVYVLTWLLAPFIADLFSDHPQVVRLIVLYLHLVPIGYGFQGMVMLLASALNGVRASAVSLLINGIRLFVFLLPGSWLGAKLGRTGDLSGDAAGEPGRRIAGMGVCPPQIRAAVPSGEILTAQPEARDYSLRSNSPSMVLPPPRGDCPGLSSPGPGSNGCWRAWKPPSAS